MHPTLLIADQHVFKTTIFVIHIILANNNVSCRLAYFNYDKLLGLPMHFPYKKSFRIQLMAHFNSSYFQRKITEKLMNNI